MYVEEDDPRRDLPSVEEITSMFELIFEGFREAHAKHARPYVPGEGIARRSFAACRHLRDQIYGSPLSHITAISAHVWSNATDVRFCLACSRQAFKIERYMCGTCGHPNPYPPGHYRAKDRECAINSIYQAPLILHIPLCHRCERIIVRYRASRKPVSVA